MSTARKVIQLQERQARTPAGWRGGNVSLSDSFVRLIEHSLRDGQVARRDILRTVCDTFYRPEWVRLDLEQWLIQTGTMEAMGSAVRSLPPCPFTEQQLRAADENNEIAIVVPAGLRREHLAKAFDIRHWAISETDVALTGDSQGAWLLVSANDALSFLGKSCSEAVSEAEKSGHTGLSLEEYVLFAQRFRYLMGRLPDSTDWTWLPRSSYASSLVLCGGFPAYNDLFVNVWPWAEFQGNIGLRMARRFDSEGGKTRPWE